MAYLKSSIDRNTGKSQDMYYFFITRQIGGRGPRGQPCAGEGHWTGRVEWRNFVEGGARGILEPCREARCAGWRGRPGAGTM